MPYLKIQTNTPSTETDHGPILKTLSATVADMLGKSEQYVMVALETGTPMVFAGTDAPAAYVEIKSLGLPEDKTATFSATLCDCISQQLGITADRIYIEFAGPPRHMWGWNNKVF